MISKKKIDVKNTIQIHSQAKLDFYRKYLERYIRILYNSSQIERVNIFDVFCGSGIYDDGGKGSPILCFDLIKEIYYQSKHTNKINLYVNDAQKERVDNVREYIDSKNNNYCSMSYHNKDISEMFNFVLGTINKSTSSKIRNLVFIDPYGYKDIKKEIITELIKNKKTEIILFLPISHMYRFTQVSLSEEEKSQYKPLKDFIESFFPDEHPIKSEKINTLQYIEYISDALNFNKEYYSTSYYIERDSVNYFALFFISSSIYGFEKILEVKWSLDEGNPNGFNLPKEAGLFDDEEKEDVKQTNFEKLKNIFIDGLNKEIDNREIYLMTLRYGFLPKHANEVLKYLEKNNYKFKVLDINERKPARKHSFYVSWDNYNNKEPKVVMFIEK